MKVRVLYPLSCNPFLKKPASGGDIVDIEAPIAEALIAEGAAERPDAKPPVEQATAAPGEKRARRKKTA